MSARTLDELLRTRRVIVCCGAGGVGKTTTAAALGLAAARRGRWVLVCTIDPAKRLANSLGLSTLDDEERPVSRELLEAGGVTLPERGALHAMMLDTKRTFDRLVQRYAPTPEQARAILENHVYQRFSGQLAGSQEYMSMEKLHELHESGRYDLVILDTPPTKNALDFLSAPRRLAEFLDGSVLQWFVAPWFQKASGVTATIVQAMAKKVIDWLDGLFGLETVRELSEFFRAFEGLWGGFKERAERVTALLSRADTTAFVIVTSPLPESVDEARFFLEKLGESRMPLGAVVANRVHTDFVAGVGAVSGGEAPAARDGRGEPIEAGALARVSRDPDARGFLEERLRADFPGDAAAQRAVVKALDAFAEEQELARRDRETLAPLAATVRARGAAFREVPAFETDVHDVAGLARLDGWLVEAAPGASAG